MKSRSKLRSNKINQQFNQSSEGGKGITPTEFSFSLTKVAVSQICRSVGFKSVQSSALETLTVTATKYLEAIGKLAASFSQASNRTESNLFDLINVLHDLYSSQGFPDSSCLHLTSNRLMESSLLKETSDFVASIDEIPFAKPIPRETETTELTVSSNDNLTPRSFGDHIPKWLPDFPDAKTYKDEIAGPRQVWENSDSVRNSHCIGEAKVLEQKLRNGDLPKMRENITFKFGGKRKRWEGNSIPSLTSLPASAKSTISYSQSREIKKKKKVKSMEIKKKKKVKSKNTQDGFMGIGIQLIH